ncbi:3-oxoacyl-[acyl-carrier-protein] synthase III C-terminal domain-containing protein [Virgibacillus sp. LDC-1]|uniref:type III polyketide synthase n=1 Tax=Virgibacillus sp. LDC-1 TaxID=3039856 RepID=UPI0024DEE10C|nr:3-oxoacyl-[acyl-carrier-protein] synthase III C-terminal domain-containing protein [Virgibacillus sp. LDC-1]
MMAIISSVGLGIPEFNVSQSSIKTLVEQIFPYTKKEVERLLPVFDNASIHNRQFAVDTAWFMEEHSFQEKNDLYQQESLTYSLTAMDDCLESNQFHSENIPYEAVDMLIYVSSTGIATPSMDVRLMNERPFRADTKRMPLWGLGCAGGAIGLSRAFDWLSAHPEKTVMLVCCELCSLTFQKNDRSKSNLIGTALFGDGVGAVLLVGEKSPYRNKGIGTKGNIKKTSSFTKKNSESIMGWKITNHGFEVIFSKSIPSFVKTVWKDHVIDFLTEMQLEEIDSFIAHPGGKKVLQAMEETLAIEQQKLIHSYNVLMNHGNMSSATVLYVLFEWMQDNMHPKKKSILSALGPGFSSELLLLEWI